VDDAVRYTRHNLFPFYFSPGHAINRLDLRENTYRGHESTIRAVTRGRKSTYLSLGGQRPSDSFFGASMITYLQHVVVFSVSPSRL
jgi:hypothetical protein